MQLQLGIFVVLLGLSATPARGQSPEKGVRATVQQALDGLINRDTVALWAVFDSNAQLALVSYTNEQSSLTWIPIGAIIRTLSEPGPARREEIRNEHISIVSDLATVVADYVFYFGDDVHHCGGVMYDLVRANSRWQIVQIRQTDRRTGCIP